MTSSYVIGCVDGSINIIDQFNDKETNKKSHAILLKQSANSQVNTYRGKYIEYDMSYVQADKVTKISIRWRINQNNNISCDSLYTDKITHMHAKYVMKLLNVQTSDWTLVKASEYVTADLPDGYP